MYRVTEMGPSHYRKVTTFHGRSQAVAYAIQRSKVAGYWANVDRVDVYDKAHRVGTADAGEFTDPNGYVTLGG